MRPLVAKINLSAIKDNFKIIRNLAPKSKIMAVLKANAYGHGLVQVAKILCDADGFAVITIDEALALRSEGIKAPIILLQGFFSPDEIPFILEHHLVPVVHCFEQIEMLTKCEVAGVMAVFVKINTGMNRLGFRPSQIAKTIHLLRGCKFIDQITLMTHFACADEADGISKQISNFKDCAELSSYSSSVANSAALFSSNETHLDWVRPGIALYGASPFEHKEPKALGLRPAMTLLSRVIAIQQIYAGESVGYGLSFTAENNMTIGIVACGYADGYPRSANSNTPVIVNGVRSKIVGRVSMDMLCVDLTYIPNPHTGIQVELWGENLGVDEVARSAGTIGYELLSSLTKRVPHAYDSR